MGVGVIDEFELVSGLIESGSNPDIVSLSSVSVILNALILLYVMLPGTRRAFGQS